MLLFVAAFPLAAGAQWRLEADGHRVYDDNLSRAQRSEDILDDSAWTGRVALARRLALGDWDASVHVEGRAERYDEFSGLDRLALGLGGSARRKLGLGLTAPWLGLSASVLRDRYDQEVRDGTRLALAATLGKRFSERLELSAGAGYDRREQRKDLATTPVSGKPFSLQGRSLSLNGNYAFTDRLLLLASAARRQGDVVSSTRRNFQIFTESSAIADDPAFGPDFIAYRLSGARTHSYSLGLSWELWRRATIDAFATRSDTKARGGLDYDSNGYSVAFGYRY